MTAQGRGKCRETQVSSQNESPVFPRLPCLDFWKEKEDHFLEGQGPGSFQGAFPPPPPPPRRRQQQRLAEPGWGEGCCGCRRGTQPRADGETWSWCPTATFHAVTGAGHSYAEHSLGGFPAGPFLFLPVTGQTIKIAFVL